MKWLLVVIVMNSPVKTDLVFNDLNACLRAESNMRKAWADQYNASPARFNKEAREAMLDKFVWGTCIPTTGR